MDPHYDLSGVTSKEKHVPSISVLDRTSNLEAMTLGFAAEKGLSFSDVPDLIEFAKVRPNAYSKF